MDSGVGNATSFSSGERPAARARPRRLRVALVAAAAALLGTAGRPADDEAGTLRCRLAGQRVVIDGELDEACWRRADVATDFKLLERGGSATQRTECRVTYDAQNLYVAFVCLDARPREILARHLRDDGPVWRDDCVEVFLDTQHDHKNYFHLISNALGTRFEEKGPAWPNPPSWNADWKVATRVSDHGWQVEMAIPFGSMGLGMPEPGTVWGFNANRQEYRLRERSSWAETLRSFHEPRHFGHLLFVPPS